MQTDVRFTCDDGFSMPGLLTTPTVAGSGPRPALLMIYEAFGLNEEMARVARELSEEGWTVLIPDLFARGRGSGGRGSDGRGSRARARGGRTLCIARCLRTVATGEGVALDDLESARRWMVRLPEVDAERIGVIGFCMGGGFALLLAMNGHYRASAPFYGLAPRQMPSSCPVVGSYGELDRSMAGAPQRIERNLDRLGVPHDVKVYPGVGHSFYTRSPNRIMTMVGPHVPGMPLGYDEASAADAHERVVAFFRQHLDVVPDMPPDVPA